MIFYQIIDFLREKHDFNAYNLCKKNGFKSKVFIVRRKKGVNI